MAIFGRPSIIPKDVIARATLTQGEKLLASAELDQGGWLLATAAALYRQPALPGVATAGGMTGTSDDASGLGPGADAEPGGLTWRREWTDVDLARFNGPGRELTIRWVTGQGEETYLLAGSVTRHFTRTVNERVTASVVASREVKVTGGVARIAVRRRPDRSLFSQVITIGRVDPADPATASAINEAEGQLREAAGMSQ